MPRSTPSRVQYFLAHATLISAWVGSALIVAILLATCGMEVLASVGSFWRPAAWGLLAMAGAIPLGWLLGLIFVSPFVLEAAKWINGGPFAVGDEVWVLAGPHRGKRGRVYELWPTRLQLRVDLGPEAAKRAGDVLGVNQVCRWPPSFKSRPASPDGAAQS